MQLSYNSGGSTVDLTVLSVKGAAEPDHLTKFPGLIHEMLDGSLSSQNAGSRRNIEIQFQVMTSANLRKAVDWWAADDAQIICLAGRPTLDFPSLVTGGSLLTFKQYDYQIRAIDTIGGGVSSFTGSCTTDGSSRSIKNDWGAIANTRCYAIYRQNVTDGGHWFLIDYTTDITYTDTGVITDALAIRDLGVSVPPSAASTINVVTEGDYILDWTNDTELGRILTVNVRETSIFLKASGFPV